MQDFSTKSGIIAALVYDDNRRKLRTVFEDCEVRLFKEVPPHITGELVSAPSPGQYHIDHIRKRFPRLAA